MDQYKELYESYKKLSESLIKANELLHEQMKDLEDQLEERAKSGSELAWTCRTMNQIIDDLMKKYDSAEVTEIVNKRFKEAGFTVTSEEEPAE